VCVGLFSKNFVVRTYKRSAIIMKGKKTSNRNTSKDFGKCKINTKRRGQRVNDQRSDWVNQNDKTPSFDYALRISTLLLSYAHPLVSKK
jgi:hypothetical protein